MVLRGKKGKSPPFMSQEFIIQNHGDIVSCVCMVVMVGLMFQVTQPLAQTFIAAQYNVTKEADSDSDVMYTSGVKDLCTIFFYTLCWIVLHAIIQEYILDKFNKRFHMSKTKYNKFNDSGNILPFYLLSIWFAIEQIQKLGIMQNFSKLWENYPAQEMSFMNKFYFILQIAYWLHCFPELYFMKVKKEDVKEKVPIYCLYLAFISAAYIMSGTRIAFLLLAIHYVPEALFDITRIIHCAGKTDISQHGFVFWALSFVLARIATISLAVFIIGFGLSKYNVPNVDIAQGNFNTQTLRVGWLAAIVLIQAWMAWNFITFQVRRYRERTPQKKPKSDGKQEKKKKKHENGLEKSPSLKNKKE
ncbi:translocating chain-associated membrane protein 1-like 1 [Hydra vulgaris]|uniref:Translocating chain-associated membrane protein 1-like 1 n=1 Tax=Hydra vulgaris TaxID=6087 RepID=A0ABM4BSG5_HYDVU